MSFARTNFYSELKLYIFVVFYTQIDLSEVPVLRCIFKSYGNLLETYFAFFFATFT